MWLIYSAIGAIVLIAVIFFVFMSMSNPEAKNIKGALTREVCELERLSYEQLEELVKKEGRVELSFGATKYIRTLSSGVVDQGPTRSLRVRVALTGTTNNTLEEAAVITKRKDLSKVV